MGVIDPSAERQPGYLDKAALPDSLALLPAPPAAGSPAFALDEQVNREGRGLLTTPRGHQAALGPVLPQCRRHLRLCAGRAGDARGHAAFVPAVAAHAYRRGPLVSKAKDHYQRAAVHGQRRGPTCAPEDEDGLRKNGSYPSGHTAIGWAWALTLAEVAPDRADAVCARARLCRKLVGVQRALAERRPRRPLHTPAPWPGCTSRHSSRRRGGRASGSGAGGMRAA
jgi:acid phosphatase (class A)